MTTLSKVIKLITQTEEKGEAMEKENEVIDLNLFQRLAKIRELSGVVSKSKQGYGYKYASIADILANVTAGMKKYHVSLIPSMVPETQKVETLTIYNKKPDKRGDVIETTATEQLFTTRLVMKWICDDNPEDSISVDWYAVASMTDPGQAMGAALTYSQRQFLVAYFQIAQPDQDLDDYKTKQKQAEEAEDLAIAEAIIKEFDTLVRTYLADNEARKEDVAKFCKKYEKKGDYFKVKDPKLASKMLNDFKEQFVEAKPEEEPKQKPKAAETKVKK